MGYRFLVTAILVVHFAFLAYVVLGGLLAIRWPRAFWPHLAAVGWGVVTVAFSIVCPLTSAEDWARQRAGEAALTKGFIDRYIEGVLYPERYTGVLWALAAVVIAGSWLLAYRSYLSRSHGALGAEKGS
jgi:hypothetical protein